jgi:nickel/cobalt transporter (NicO) family protein
MQHQKWQRSHRVLLAGFSLMLVYLLSGSPSQAHWADLAVADVKVDRQSAEILLTIPTGLVGSADDNRDGQLSAGEIATHRTQLQATLAEKVRLTDARNQPSTLHIEPSDLSALPTSLQGGSESHSSLKLIYSWPEAIVGLNMQYRLFEPGVPTARCFATITSVGDRATQGLKNNSVKNVIFSPDNQEASLFSQSPFDLTGGIWVTLLAAFVWGAAHAMSPGHGKTLVGAYLIGERATAGHALFLGLTTTVTHTLGVFTLGIATFWASRSFLPEQLFPWLSLLSGLLVVVIGGNLLRDRLPFSQKFIKKSHFHHHTHADHAGHAYGKHTHEHDTHDHHTDHHHSHQHHFHHHTSDQAKLIATPDHHSHSHFRSHSHSHLPSGTEGQPVSWRSLLALGVSGGLIPCPSALVLLLSAIALGQIGYGLLLVVAFSLGLAAVLTGLGLLLVYSKQLFSKRIFSKLSPQQGLKIRRIVQFLPTLTAFAITIIGVGISMQALWQIRMVHL